MVSNNHEPFEKEFKVVEDHNLKVRRMEVMTGLGVAVVFLVIILGMFIYIFIAGGTPTETRDIEDYGKFDDFKGYSNLLIFPEVISNDAENVIYYYYERNTLFDSENQIYLSYTLPKDLYEKEIERLSAIKVTYENKNYKHIVHEVVYDEEHFNHQAYVTIFNNNNCYEYVLVDDVRNELHYIYRQFIEENDIVIDQAYMPIKDVWSDIADGFNIYYSDFQLGYFEKLSQ